MRHRTSYQAPAAPRRRTRRPRLVAGVVVLAAVAALTGVTSGIASAQERSHSHHLHHHAVAAHRWHSRANIRLSATRPRVVGSATSGTASTTASASTSASASASPTTVTSAAASATTTASATPSTSASPAIGTPSTAGTLSRLFAADSPWNTTIPAGAATDPDSSRIVSSVLANPDLVMNLNLDAYGIPFYTATASTPRVRVGGGNPLNNVPIDPSWKPNQGADHKMNVLDPATHTVFELQGYTAATHSAYWAVKRDYTTSLADGFPQDGLAGPTGSGLTQAGGVVRMSEIASGSIDHALSFITSKPTSQWRYPASHSDGTASGVGLAEGMRIQLDPTLDVDAIPGITPGEKAIAKALQQYGAYCTDNGGGNDQAMGFYMESPQAGEANPYPAAGFTQDWQQLPHIPRDRLRVLAASVTPKP